MRDVTTFVAVHDEGSLMRAVYEFQGKLPNVKLLFLGPKQDVDFRLHKDYLIRCTDYEPDMRNLYDFVGFGVLAKHNLIDTKYSIFLQYDHTVLDPDLSHLEYQLGANLGMVTFVPAGYDQKNWMLQVPDFVTYWHQALAAVGCGQNYENLDVAWWPTTQGHAWRSSAFYAFMQWIAPALPVLQDYQYGGHVVERLLYVYTTLTHPAQVITGLFQHNSHDVHGTGALMAGRVDEWQQKDSVFGR